MKSMSSSNSDSAEQAVKRVSSLYLARLMRPTEVAEATMAHPSHVQLHVADSWMLCGDMSAAMFSLLKTLPDCAFPTRLSAFSSNFKGAYGVITHQVGHHQHRFVLCLHDPIVREFLESIPNQEFGFMLGNNEESDALVFRNPIKSTDFLPLLALSYQTTDSQQREVLMELPLVISAMTNPLQVPSIFKGQAVREVSVSLLLPTILKGAVDRSNPVEDMA